MPDHDADGRTAPTTTPDPLRLQLKPTVPATGYVDGAWWPRTRHLPAELPGLLAELTGRAGSVALVGYHRSAWDDAPEHLDVAGATVGLEGFSSDSPATVLVIGTAGERVTLLVVPPETTEDQAQQLLAAAGRPDPVEDPDAGTHTARSLDDLVTRLARVHGRTDPQRTALIGTWVQEAAQQFAHVRIDVFVPILVEHIVRGRLRTAGTPPEPTAPAGCGRSPDIGRESQSAAT